VLLNYGVNTDLLLIIVLCFTQRAPGAPGGGGPGGPGGGLNLGGLDFSSMLNNPALMNMVGIIIKTFKTTD
jgi:hypothetical protein